MVVSAETRSSDRPRARRGAGGDKSRGSISVTPGSQATEVGGSRESSRCPKRQAGTRHKSQQRRQSYGSAERSTLWHRSSIPSTDDSWEKHEGPGIPPHASGGRETVAPEHPRRKSDVRGGPTSHNSGGRRKDARRSKAREMKNRLGKPNKRISGVAVHEMGAMGQQRSTITHVITKRVGAEKCCTTNIRATG